MKVNKVTIVIGSGTDKLILGTDLPNGVYPYTGTATAEIEVGHGGGENYAATHFPGIDVTVVKTNKKR